MTEVLLGVTLFTLIVMSLVVVILGARARLVTTGEDDIVVNDQRTLHIPAGDKLLGVLAEAQLFVASACGGGGTCGQCRVKVLEGGGQILPTERSLITRREAADGDRLACQSAVKQSMRIQVPDEVFGVRKWECAVRSTTPDATFLTELVLELPHGDTLDFRAGGYIRLNVRRTKSSTGISISTRSTAKTGIASSSGISSRKSSRRSSGPTRWPITHSRMTSSC